MKASSRRKPPLPLPTVSPRRLRPSRSVASGASCRTPPASCRFGIDREQMAPDEPELSPVYQTMTAELHKLARRVEEEFGRSFADPKTPLASQLSQLGRRSPLFERGKHYQEYAARRSDRLRRRRRATLASSATDLGVVVGKEMAKKRATKRTDASRNSMSVSRPSASCTYNLRSSTYNLRSKETTATTPLPPAATSLSCDVVPKRTPATRSRKLIKH